MTERVPEFSGKTRGVYLKIRVCSGSRESDLDGTRAGEWSQGAARTRYYESRHSRHRQLPTGKVKAFDTGAEVIKISGPRALLSLNGRCSANA